MEKKIFELTNPQKSIWNMEEFFEGTTINNICTPAIIHEKIDENILKKAINNVVQKNDSFRIRIILKNDSPLQYISDFEPFEIEVLHLKAEKDLKEVEKEEVNYKFNIIDSCLFHFKIVIFENGFGAIILTVNHIIADSWSLGLVIKNILEEYHSLKNGIVLSSAQNSYIDYINSEKEYKKSKKYELDKKYWNEVFETIPEPSTIPPTKNINNEISYDAKRIDFSINKNIVKNINNFCSENKISIFNFFMTIYSIYLSKVSNSNDFVIGTPILNRINFREKQTMGMFVNMVPVRVKIPNEEEFFSIAHNISLNMLSILKHQKYSYDQILNDLRNTHNNIANLYNVTFSYQITKAFNKEYGDYSTDWVFNNYCANDLNIHITDINDTGKLVVSYDYLTNKYEKKDMQNIHSCILHIINQVLNNKNILINKIGIITEKEKNKILNDFNNNSLAYPQNKNIVDLFEEQAEKNPNNIAVVFKDEKLTYRELNDKANSLANYFLSIGVKKGDIIPVILNRSTDLIISMLAIIKVGGIYLPISPEIPIERINFIFKNCKAKFAINETDLILEKNINNKNIKKINYLKNINSKNIAKINYSKNNKKINIINIKNLNYLNFNKNNLNIKITPNDLLYIIYTSGSTGNPKGVKVCHKNLVNFIYSFTNMYGDISSQDRLLASTNISFDVSIFEFYISLLNGCSLYLYDEPNINDIYKYCDCINKNKITFAYIAPNLLDIVYDILSKNNKCSLNKILIGVEPIKNTTIKKYYSLNKNIKIINAYGPTETTICATAILLNKNLINNYKIIPIGKPLNNLQIFILDKNLMPVPTNTIGEIYIAGDNVSKGYLNNEDLTKKAFVSLPHLDCNYAYKTGDLAKWDDNGIINFIGRNDNQVKINGHRIELGEIEACMYSYTNINKAIILLDKNNKIICYFSSDKKINIDNLKTFLKKKLPSYFIPNFFMQVNKFELTANGKIDRKKLPEIKYDDLKKDIILPRNNIDSKLIEILEDLLKIKPISIDDSFFDLGGDSLSAINLCVKIKNELKAQIFVKDILENPKVQDLSDIILKNIDTSKKQIISKTSTSEFYPASSSQKRMYFASQVAGNSSILYNISGGVILDGNIDLIKLENCFNILINRHESLRTCFEIYNENVVQKVLENINFKLQIVNDENFDNLNILFKDFVKPFDLAKAPLFRAKFISFTNGKSAILLDMHHIISDGSSMSILVDELCKLYNDEVLPELTISYKDFAVFENNEIDSEEFKKAEDYWISQFSGEIPVLNLPIKHTRPTVQSFEGAKVYSAINEDLTEKLKNLSEALGVTPYMLLLSAYYVLLSKYTSQYDIIVGSPIANRNMLETYNLIGMFVNTLALREKIDTSFSFRDFVLTVKNNLLKAYEYQSYPFDELVNKLNLKRDTSRNPLFDTMFIYQNNGYKKLNFKNIKSEYYIPDTNISKFDLSLEAIPMESEIKLSFEYATKLFDEEFIENLSEHYLNILKVILENVDTTIANIDMLSVEEKNKILYDFNDTKVNYSKDKTISVLFEEQVQNTPNNIALVFENETLTYKELNEKANSLAYYLRNNGIGRNNLVGIMVNRSFEMIISILAVLKAGSAYIPIDPTYPKDRIEYMLSNSNSKILLTQKHLENKINFENKLFIDLSNTEIYSLPNENLKNINTPEDLSYVIYTSGSTGVPKGVMLTHKALSNLTNYCNNYVEYLKEPIYRTIVSITTMSFDIFIFETLISLQKGLKLVIANENEQNIPNLLNDLIEKNNVKIIQATPSRMQIFLNNLNSIPALKDLDYITLAGEQLPLSLVNTLQELCGANVYNGYGPSETTVFSTLTKMDVKTVTIGKPLDNTQIYILDNNLNPTPIGISGEIYISGDGVGKGYLNNIELTNKSFIKNPFIADSIMYKTGDLGMYTNDRNILCLGRSDNQVKIRGQRIELSEIEDKISKIPSINSCVVIKNIDEESHEFLCAYFTADENINASIIRKSLGAFLPQYMIPQYFMQMESLPYTPNGKIDRNKLPKIKYEDIKKEIVLPRNDIDSKLIEILEDLLKIKTISIDDSFFDIGGDSLSAINLCVRIQNEFYAQIFVKDILENPRIEDLSDIIFKKINTAEMQTIPKADNKEFYPVSSAQRRMYFASEVAGNSSVLYNISGAVILDRIIDTQKLEECFNILINRHETLRTYFELNSESVVQKVLDNINFKLPVINDENFDNLHDLFKSFVKPFDLSKAPLFRTKFVSFTNGKSAIFLDMHHIISDGSSLSILVDELCKLYNNEALPKLNISYKDFAVFENNKLNSDEFKDAKNYWLSQFSGEIPILNLPTNHPRPAVQSFEGKKVYSLINKDLTQKIKKISDSLGITPYMLLLSAYYILLSKYTSQNDIVVGSPIIGRDILETYNLIGMFVNTLALREKIDISSSFKDFVLSVKNNLLKTYKYQTYPFDELVSNLNLKRDISRNPLFDTMFIYQNNGYKELNFKNIKSEYYIPDTNISKFDLSLEAVPTNNEIKLSFEYATKLFDEDFIKNLSEHYLNILKSVLENINTKIADIDMLSESEKNKILYEFNNTAVDYPKNKSISVLFEEQAQKTPDNIALVFGDEKLTYKELNEKANSLAHYLRNNGIDRNDLVGIMVNRSLEMIISILAVLKAGAAYIPIDPTYPKDRIEYMLSNSNAKILLTQLLLEEKINYENKVLVDLDNEEIYSFPTENLENINLPNDLAYVIFTSGSTGKPKGVMITHKVLSNFTNYCNNYVDYLKLPVYRGIVSITTISFDIFVYETIISLQKGLKVIIANENEQTTPTLLNDLIKNNNAEIIQSTPSIMQIFINNLASFPELKNLKYITLAGEQLPLSLVHSLHKICGAVVYNGYGPSETYYCSLTKMNDEIVTIGKPIYNSQMYILNENLTPVPIGITGEIYISGECVGKGYLNNAELTNKNFIENPFIPNTMMYKSGDLGMYTENGDIICLGRTDHQIKIRGLRIELGEIEELIENYPNISKVAVIKQSINNRDFLSAYYVQSKKIIVNELRKYLSKSLPKYMVPSYYIALDDFPYTPNGKVDRKALPLPTEILNISNEHYVAPKTSLQKKLVTIWEKILNTSPIGINDNFFELGGDSLLAMNLIIELLKISTKIQYSDIFRFPTISELEGKINSDNDTPVLGKIENLSNSHINILKNCTKRDIISTYHPKNILLTGSTGFLGIHILEKFINTEKGKIYCIVREVPGLTAKARLHEKLNYYFGNKYDDFIDNRIIVLNGDTSKPGFGLNQNDLLDLANSIDIVVNSAANVFHFGNYSTFYNTNVVSVKYMIEFCNSFNKKLYHVSTIGIAGTKLDSTYLAAKKKYKKANVTCNESCLYVGQVLNNVYTRSKFEAEKILLDAIAEGLDAYILRIGHLMPRYKDGIFQENILDNELVQKCIAFVNLGIIPNYLLNISLDITPVDFAASAIYKLITHPSRGNRIFHLYNQHTVSVNKYLKQFKKMGYNLDVLSENDFRDKVRVLLKDDNKKHLLNNLIRDFDDNFNLDYKTDIKMNSKFTIKYLKKLNFRWPKITNRYIFRFINLLRKVM